MNTSMTIFEAMTQFFTKDGWPFTQLEERPILLMNFKGENGQWRCAAQAREEQEQFVFYSVCPVNVPEDKRLVVAEFIMRVNFGLIIGNFEMDLADGEIRYKTGIDVEDDRLSFALIKQMVYANVMMMDRYLPGIMQVIYSNVSPLDAVMQIEK